MYLENSIEPDNKTERSKAQQWCAVIRIERRTWASDSASLHLRMAPQSATTFVQIMILPR